MMSISRGSFADGLVCVHFIKCHTDCLKMSVCLLDLSALFDSMDHNLLLPRLEGLVGVSGPALDSLSSHLADRTMCVSVSGSQILHQCFSVIDSQIYLLLNKGCSVIPLLFCLQDIKDWMALTYLSFIEKKTKVMVFGPSSSCDPSSVELAPFAAHLKQSIKWTVILNLTVKLAQW
uniref:Reverse transcriptase domain-containing protein n=1 Tax=Oryzias latipes TaxID=8090 RepID=A0A3P9H470_ORYLA